ncbi:MAG TPA: CarD family transcriptional regulator [Gaiellaceae bacterium]|jgi:RNA polymerase-interacting CarD/CdnL/TRCF family regulator|nr:CarD family transcriptional regulator [Gaiellaceae bacterium]
MATRIVKRVDAGGTESTMSGDFAVGDVVVYASHGIGRVESTKTAGEATQLITLSFAGGLTVTLPLARAVEALRPLSSERDLETVRTTLCAATDAQAEPWSRRYRRTREKVTSGAVAGLAEVVRDGVHREQSQAANGGSTAPSDRQLYLQARGLLIAEIALCRGIEPAAAEAWILEQVGTES